MHIEFTQFFLFSCFDCNRDVIVENVNTSVPRKQCVKKCRKNLKV